MPRTSRITYGQCLILGSPRPANQSNLTNLTGMKRIQSANMGYTFARERFKQIGSPNFVGDVNITNPEITLEMNYYYSNGTNEILLGLDVDGSQRSALFGLQRPNQSNNFYILFGSGVNSEVLREANDNDFQDKYNVMGLGDCFLNSYALSAAVGAPVTVTAIVQADNMQLQRYSDATNGELIPAIDPSTQKPTTTNKYKILTSSFKDTTNQDGLIESAFAPSGIRIVMPADVNVPGLEFTGEYGDAIVNSVEVSFSIDRTALYGFGSIYPFGRRALMPVLGQLSFSALATEFEHGRLHDLVILDNNTEKSFDFTINVLGVSGTTGLQLEVQGAKVDSESLSQVIGDNASIDATLSFSMSDRSGLKYSTPPLILSQPVGGSVAGGDDLTVVATGKSNLSYKWYGSGGEIAGQTQPTYTPGSAGDYYSVISNDLGAATTNTATMTT